MLTDGEHIYDVFISHASEDKDSFVRKLAETLKELNISVWYDEFSLQLGDSLTESIDNGLSKSKYGIVVLSPYFFTKNWPKWEIKGLIQLHIANGKKILPIWHNVSHQEVMEYSSPLADIVAIESKLGLEYVIEKILSVVKPKESSMEFARRRLIEIGYKDVPSLNSEWWLDVIEYDGYDINAYPWPLHVGYLFQHDENRGQILSNKVILRKWHQVIEEKNLSNITHPKKLLKEINAISGLFELLKDNIHDTIRFAPFLTLPQYEGDFESFIIDLYESDKTKHSPRTKIQGGYSQTIDNNTPSCSRIFALRDPNMGFYKPGILIEKFFRGSFYIRNFHQYDYFEYLIWLLSKQSMWLPENTRETLIIGFKQWPCWHWSGLPSIRFDHFKKSEYTGSLYHEMIKQKNKKKFIFSNDSIQDIKERINWSLELIEAEDEIEEIYKRFIEKEFVEAYLRNDLI